MDNLNPVEIKMPYTKEDWINRLKRRTDLGGQVAHFTRPAEIGGKQYTALQVLLKILRERTIKAGGGYVRGKAVCFQDAPVYSLSQNLDYEYDMVNCKRRENCRYEPFGLMFLKPYVFCHGGRPVIYDIPDEAERYVNEENRWRIVSYDLRNQDDFKDWTHEREWRMKDDFGFEIGKATVLLPHHKFYKLFFEESAKDGEDVAPKVKAVLTLASVLI